MNALAHYIEYFAILDVITWKIFVMKSMNDVSFWYFSCEGVNH